MRPPLRVLTLGVGASILWVYIHKLRLCDLLLGSLKGIGASLYLVAGHDGARPPSFWRSILWATSGSIRSVVYGVAGEGCNGPFHTN